MQWAENFPRQASRRTSPARGPTTARCNLKKMGMLLLLLRPRIRPPSLRTTLTLALGEFLRAGSAPRSNSMPAIVVGGIQPTRFSSAPTPLRAGLSLLTSFLTDHHLLPEGRDFGTDACQFAPVLHGWQDGVRSVRGALWRKSHPPLTRSAHSHPTAVAPVERDGNLRSRLFTSKACWKKRKKRKGGGEGGSFPPTVVACR